MSTPDFLSVREIAILGFILFTIGAVGVIARRNLIVILMCAELMLNSVNLLFVAFSRGFNDTHGQLAVLFVMGVAAAEAAVGLALVIALFRNARGVLGSDIQELKDT
ncbi:MAG: NADH-quinone oxidoreductase subunit NuoK [Turneriella sp.]|nr:NADH-quinone oxidoreductase subunit NuoK [Turneriella sp.]